MMTNAEVVSWLNAAKSFGAMIQRADAMADLVASGDLKIAADTLVRSHADAVRFFRDRHGAADAAAYNRIAVPPARRRHRRHDFASVPPTNSKKECRAHCWRG